MCLPILKDKQAPSAELENLAIRFSLAPRKHISIDEYVQYEPNAFNVRDLDAIAAVWFVDRLEIEPRSDFPDMDPPILRLHTNGDFQADGPRKVFPVRATFSAKSGGIIQLELRFESSGLHEIVVSFVTDLGTTESAPFRVLIRQS